MSSRPGASPEMDAPEGLDAKFAERIRQIAATLPYLATPDLAAHERQRLTERRPRVSPYRRGRLSIGLALLFIALMAALLVSPVRARVLEWIRIGSVRIFFSLQTPTAPIAEPSGAPSPAVTPTYLQSVLDLAGESSLSEAQEQAEFTILLPAYPSDLGQPEHIYLQQLGGPAVIMVWMDPDQPGQVRMSLSESASDEPIFEKYQPKSVLDTQVGGQPAVWMDGDYLLVMRNGDASLTRMVDQSHTLIWSSGEMTFRLETDVDFETAIRIAESIR